MPTDTRQRLIDAARTRFYRDGFRNVGVDAVLDDVGISKTAFYKHFQSKEDLMIAVLEGVDHFIQEQFREMVRDRGGPGAVGQLRAFMDVVQKVIESEDFHGCIFVNAAMEFPLLHDPAHIAAARHKQSIERFVYELGERAGVADPSALARQICMIVEGAYVTWSLTSDPSTIYIARGLVDAVIDRHLPAH